MSVNTTESDDPPGEFEEIEVAEEELIDAYVRGELSLDERRLLEKGLRSSPELVERLHFARLLADAADRTAAAEAVSDRRHDPLPPARKTWWLFGLRLGPRPAFQLAFAACVLIIFMGGAGILAGWIRLRRESRQLAEQQATLERQKLELQKSASEQRLATEQLRAQLKEEQQKREADQQRIAELQRSQDQKTKSSPSPIGNLATFFLLPSSRSGGENEFSPAAGTSKIRLQLAVESIDYRGFVAEVKNSQDREIFRGKLRPPRSAKHVTITLPSNLLPPGAYSIQLSGISPDGATELVGNYSFRIATSHSQK